MIPLADVARYYTGELKKAEDTNESVRPDALTAQEKQTIAIMQSFLHGSQLVGGQLADSSSSPPSPFPFAIHFTSPLFRSNRQLQNIYALFHSFLCIPPWYSLRLPADFEDNYDGGDKYRTPTAFMRLHLRTLDLFKRHYGIDRVNAVDRSNTAWVKGRYCVFLEFCTACSNCMQSPI